MTPLEAAISYHQKGYSVIPVGPDKIPLLSWKEFQDRRASLEEIVKWWENHPKALVGIVTGPVSNLTVIDVEQGGNFDVVKDETFTVKTGGGGRHFFFQYDPDFKTGARILELTDVRSLGGYVVAAPSISQKGTYSVLKDVPVAKMSPSTKEALLGQKPPVLRDSSGGIFSVPNSSGQKFQPLDITAMMNVSEGGRNESLHKLAVSLISKHDQITAWQMVTAINASYKPPLSDQEVKVLFNSAMKFVSEHPPTTSKPRFTEFGPEDPKKSQLMKGAHAPAKIQHVAELADDPAYVPAEILHAEEVAKRQSINSDISFHTDMKPFDEALLGGFSPGDLIVVAGKSGHGKTTLIQDWSVTLAVGGKEKQEPLPSLWFSYEVLAKPLWGKFQNMGADSSTPIYLPTFNESGDSEWVAEMIEKGIKEKGVRVVVIDHLGFLRAPRGNYANAADATTHTTRALKRLAVKYGLIIMLPVHVKKSVGKNPELEDIKDASGIYQEADTVFFIERQKDSLGLPTARARMWLVKNRKTGISASALFDYQFCRYYYSEEATRQADQNEKSASESVKEFDAM